MIGLILSLALSATPCLIPPKVHRKHHGRPLPRATVPLTCFSPIDDGLDYIDAGSHLYYVLVPGDYLCYAPTPDATEVVTPSEPVGPAPVVVADEPGPTRLAESPASVPLNTGWAVAPSLIPRSVPGVIGVGRVQAPEIDTTSAASALTLLGMALIIFRRRKS